MEPLPWLLQELLNNRANWYVNSNTYLTYWHKNNSWWVHSTHSKDPIQLTCTSFPESSFIHFLFHSPAKYFSASPKTQRCPRHLFPWTRAECHLDIKHMEIVSKYRILYQSDVNSRQFFIRLNVKMRRRLLRRSNNQSSLPLFASIFNKVFLVLKTMVNRNKNSFPPPDKSGRVFTLEVELWVHWN